MENGKPENGRQSFIPVPDEPNQDSFLEIALRHRWIIVLSVALSIVFGFVYIYKSIPVYSSTSRIYVEQSTPRIIGEYEAYMTGSKNYLFTQAELIKSTPIVSTVTDKDNIRNFRTFNGIDNLTTFVKKNLIVEIGKKDDIISISFQSPYPDEAAQIVNSVVDSYIEFQSTRKQSIISKVLNILENEKSKRDKELTDKLNQILQFTRENGVVSLDNRGENIVLQKLSKISEALTEAQLATANAKADFEAVKKLGNQPAKIKQYASALPSAGVKVFVNDAETQLTTELRMTQVELKNALNHVTEGHPSVRALKKKIEYIQAELDKECKDFADAYLEVTQMRWLSAEEREAQLLESFNQQCEASQQVGVKATEFSILQSELKRAERNCEILDDRIKELNVNEDTGALNISIVETAKPSVHPCKPQKTKIMATMLVFGLLVGLGLAMIRDWLDYHLRSADEVAAVLGIPVLGVIPTMLRSGSGKGILQIKPLVEDLSDKIAHLFSPSVSGKDKTHRDKYHNEPAMLPQKREKIIARGQKVFLQPKSVIAEAYRTVRTAIFFGVPKGQAKTILVTSPAASDGKSTLVSNLGVTMAQAGQKTLLLDADFRKPMQHNIFDVSGEKGISSVLAGQISLEEAIYSTQIEKLDLLVCGPDVPNPSEILNSDAFADMLRKLSEKYDRIIIDSPPVAPVADSQILAATCDITILVLRAEKSTRRHSLQARDAIVGVGGRLLGAVINDVPRKHGRYGYSKYGYGHYGGYGYGYGYGSENER